MGVGRGMRVFDRASLGDWVPLPTELEVQAGVWALPLERKHHVRGQRGLGTPAEKNQGPPTLPQARVGVGCLVPAGWRAQHAGLAEACNQLLPSPICT